MFNGLLSWESSLSSIPIIFSFALVIFSWISWMFWVRSFCFLYFLWLLCQCLLWYLLSLRFLSSISCILLLMLASVTLALFPRFFMSRVVSLCVFFNISISFSRSLMILFNSFSCLIVFFLYFFKRFMCILFKGFYVFTCVLYLFKKFIYICLKVLYHLHEMWFYTWILFFRCFEVTRTFCSERTGLWCCQVALCFLCFLCSCACFSSCAYLLC